MYETLYIGIMELIGAFRFGNFDSFGYLMAPQDNLRASVGVRFC